MALGGAMLALAGCSAGGSGTKPSSSSPGRFKSSGATVATCPLTGAPAPNGVVPNHPAVAVKVENSPQGRPQYGLNTTDLVYEEPVEGGITRFIAVWQCQSASRIEPVRSARLVDALILPQLGDPVFGFDGGIDPSVNAVDATSAKIVNAQHISAPFTLDPDRVAPHDLETSTADLLKAAGKPKGAPSPIFTYSTTVPAGAPAATIHLDFSGSSDIWWRWDAATGLYLRSYGTVATDLTPANLGGGGQIQAANVVVEKVVLTRSPYVEDDTGVHENYVKVVGSGPAEVARNGVVIKGTWSHPTAAASTELLDGAGNQIPLAPGRTWIELLPTTSSASPSF